MELARPLDGRLFFAGEASTVGDHACCHGAFRSGVRAAKEIAEVLG
jgi:monoamine oxidase